MSNYKKLVLSAGGPKGIIMLGALDYLIKNNYLNINIIEEYWGTSIGSVICLLLSIGYSPFEIFQKFFIWDSLVESSSFESDPSNGLCNIEGFGNRVRLLILDKIGFIPTFKQLFEKTNLNLNTIGTNVDEMKMVIFNKDTFPEMSVIDAIEISCDIPLIFTRKIYLGVEYTDGGLTNEYPIDLADSAAGGGGILGIYVQDNHLESNFITKLMYIPILQLHLMRMKMVSKNCESIIIPNEIERVGLFPNRKKKFEMFVYGSNCAKKYCSSKKEGWDLDFEI